MDSILTSIKKMLGISEDDDSFDIDIIIHINSAFMILNQIGVGPSVVFSIEDSSSEWTDFMSDGPDLSAVKSFLYMKVRSWFDPPTSSTVADALNKGIDELTWRLNVMAEKDRIN